MRSGLHALHGLAVAAVLLLSTLPAHATCPGKIGRIAFIQGPDVYTMNSDGSDVKQLTQSRARRRRCLGILVARRQTDCI